MNVPTIETIRKSHMMRNIAMMLCCIMLCSVCLLGTSTVAFCEETEPVSGLDSAANDIQVAVEAMTEAIYTTMRKIITPIVIVAFGFAGFQFLLGGAQGTEKARKGVVTAIIGLVVVLFAPLFGRAIATAFMSAGSGSLSDYNPL